MSMNKYIYIINLLSLNVFFIFLPFFFSIFSLFSFFSTFPVQTRALVTILIDLINGLGALNSEMVCVHRRMKMVGRDFTLRDIAP